MPFLFHGSTHKMSLQDNGDISIFSMLSQVFPSINFCIMNSKLSGGTICADDGDLSAK